MRICFSTGSGTYWPCLRISTRRAPRSSCLRVVGVEVGGELREGRHLAVLREVEAQRAGDASIALICALPPTRLTEIPTLMAGRTPE